MYKALDEIAIVLTGHPRQQKFWGPTLLCLERYPGPIVLAYDDIDTKALTGHIGSPIQRVVVTGFEPGRLGHGPGELVCMQKGFDVAAEWGAPYAVKLGCDDPPWRWRNFTQFAQRLETESLDCIDCQTRIIFGRTAKLTDAMHLTDLTARKGSAESYWSWAVGKMGLRRDMVKQQSWWTEGIGVIHIQGEYALNAGQTTAWTWKEGELWPRNP